MKTTIALLGAGGKMGCRITDNLKDHDDYAMRYIEVSPEGLENLEARGVSATPQTEALAEADAVVLAVPDRLIGRITGEIVPSLKPGTMVVSLDPAAAHAGAIPVREDLSYFVCHPCHPPLFGPGQESAEARNDWFGGAAAPQSTVCALHHGPEEAYAVGERLAATMFAPTLRTHRITVEQMALLEPGVVETTFATLIAAMKETMDHAIAMGVPREAAEDFCYGHLRTIIAIIFGFAPFPFSDGAQLAVDRAKEKLLKEDWLDVLKPENVKRSVREITDSL